MIKEGEELLTNYGPRYANLLEKSGNPKEKIWYHELWNKFKEHHPNRINYIDYFEKRNKEIYSSRSRQLAPNLYIVPRSL